MQTPILTHELIDDLNPVEKTLLHTPSSPETGDDTISESAEIALINEGAFGCIYHPGIKCNGKLENRRYITKIQKKNSTTENEWTISRRIRKKIPTFRNFFAPISKQCPVKIQKKYIKDIRKCKVFQKETEEMITSTEYISNKIRFLGDKTMKTYFYNIVLGEITPIKSMSMETFFWKKLIETHTRLLKSIHILLVAGIIHMDIKAGNIMIEPLQHHPIFIDFGISVIHKHMIPEQSFYVYDAYTSWCFDIVVCNYVVQKIGMDKASNTKVMEDEVAEIIKTFQFGKSGSSIQNEIFNTTIVSKTTVNSFIQELTLYMKETFIDTNKTWEDVYTHFTNHKYTTWDSYALGAMYLCLLDYIKQTEPNLFHYIEIANGGKTLKTYVEILERTVFSTPNKRPAIEYTLSLLKTVR